MFIQNQKKKIQKKKIQKMIPKNIALLLLIVMLSTGLLQANAAPLSFPNSGAKAAQRDFLKGIRLLHSFSYPEAARAFQKAQHLDPDFSMAYWGEAMTYNHPTWLEQDVGAGKKVLARLGASPEIRLKKARTDREKTYLQAVETLFGESEKVARDRLYAQTMENLVLTHPEDLEAKAFYALALLGVDAAKKDHRIAMEVAGLALEILDLNPEHPGAMSYFILSVDDPIHAPLGLAVARRFELMLKSTQSPDNAIAVHMPSHIYGPMGLWNESVRVNEKSWKLSEERARNKPLKAEDRNYHALAWLHTSYLELGQYAKAHALLEIFEKDIKAYNNLTARRYLAQLQAVEYWTTQEKRPQEKAEPLKISDLQASIAACEESRLGTIAIEEKRFDDVDKIMHQLAQIIDQAQLKLNQRQSCSGEQCSNLEYSTDSLYTIAHAQVISEQLQVSAYLAHGQTSKAFAALKDLTQLFDQLPYYDEVGSMPPKPPHEMYGDVLFNNGKFEEAIKEYHLSLVSQPNRSVTLFSLAQATKKTGDKTLCHQSLAQLKENWKNADLKVKNLIIDFSCESFLVNE